MLPSLFPAHVERLRQRRGDLAGAAACLEEVPDLRAGFVERVVPLRLQAEQDGLPVIKLGKDDVGDGGVVGVRHSCGGRVWGVWEVWGVWKSREEEE